MREDRKSLAKSIDLRDFIESLGEKTLRKGDTLLALCPFHDDNSLGSFKVTKDGYKCFACSEHGDIISYVMKTQEVDFSRALDLILEKDKGMSFKKKLSGKTKKEKKELDYDLIDRAYSFMIEKSGINSSEFEYLLINRFFTKEDIDNHQLFSFDSKKALSLMVSSFTKEEVLSIPGFYNYRNNLEALSVKGLGIPIKWIDGKIRAIQVRNMEENPFTRYLFFSTSKGTSSGSPVGFLDGEKNDRIIVTEGFFKGERLNKAYNCPVFYLQGVNSYEADFDEIVQFAKNRGIDTVTICFDSDFVSKPIKKRGKNMASVYSAMVDISNRFIKEMFYAEYLIWKGKEKGFDDYYNHSKEISPYFVNKALFDAHYLKFDSEYADVSENRKETFDKEFNFDRVLS